MRKNEFIIQASISSLYTWWLMDCIFNQSLFGTAFWGTLLGFKLRRLYLLDKVARKLYRQGKFKNKQ
ncbi:MULTISPECIES: DUF3272 family protein [unclassified Enterococcus]|uniref:DUF3272 family protein n=1 Tax=unclassified Enterococcus TaxID=2608891 RepID=UPI0015532329|nr:MULTISPECIES: DUF3272 family protein [unclassified Enterococcus]MBS7577499.1 DUF3272 family protein [Enterococcus sp. MMGLQ5-2]MBS7585002.1 DUF3272 family protein [Enterococcus sp. MMGLQ5-1]NPD12857.1 DUF3272 family protein [Enterococcus sp. MMGLQ5-1]NPD37332.1 DUF3272 family protein [Enterococcus sp. MMGLQ5-2]